MRHRLDLCRIFRYGDSFAIYKEDIIMIVVLKHNPNPEQLQSLITWLQEKGIIIHTSIGEGNMLLGLVGDTANIDEELLANAEHIFRLTEEACATGSEKQLMNVIPALVTSEQEVSHDDQNA